MRLDETALLHLLELADAGEVGTLETGRAAADYRQRCKLIDRERGFSVILHRCTGRLVEHDAELAAMMPTRWYALSVTFLEPEFGPTADVDFAFADRVARTLFGQDADFAVATTATFVPGTVQINLACDPRWRPIRWPAQLPTPTWRYWSERAELQVLEVAP